MMKIKKIIGIIMLLVALSIGGIRIFKIIEIKNNVTNPLKRAVNTGAFEIAQKELTDVINYLESRGMTKGSTSIVWETHNDDVGYWFKNLNQMKMELKSLENAGIPEKNTAILKLRGTLLDVDKKSKVLVPKGIEVFPNNTFWAFLTMFALLMGFLGVSFIKETKNSKNI